LGKGEKNERGKDFVIAEILKAHHNRNIMPKIWFLRDRGGHEIDLLVESAPKRLAAVEIKSGETVSGDYFKGLDWLRLASLTETIFAS
jgi:hypothetical protein